MAQQATIESISDKVARLMDENDRLRKECESISVERDALRAENRQQKTDLAAFENKVKLLELGGGLGGGNVDTKQANASINRLMREIDRCIALMNR